MTRLICTLLLLAVSVLHAEPPRRPPPPPPFEELATALQLTQAQRAPVKAIMDAQHEEMRALHQATREERDRVRDQAQAKLVTLLSEQQMEQLRAFDAAHRPPPPPPPEEDGAPDDQHRGPPPGAR